MFLQYFHVNMLNWYKNMNSLLEGKEWPEIIVQSEPLRTRKFLTSPVSLFNFIFTIHIEICSILFWFHFEDDIVNYLSKSLFLKSLSESLFLKKNNPLPCFLQDLSGYPWGTPKPVWEGWQALKKSKAIRLHSHYKTHILCTNQCDHQLLKVTQIRRKNKSGHQKMNDHIGSCLINARWEADIRVRSV